MRTSCVRTILLIGIAVASISCGGGGGSNGGGAPSPTPTPLALTITTASPLPPTLQGHSYSTTLAAINGQGALHWSIARISPNTLFVDGVTIDPNTGVLSGTPNWASTAGFIATVTDSASPARSASATFSLMAYPPLTSGQSQTASVTEFQTPFIVRTGITGGFPPLAFHVSSGNMPPGLRFDMNGQLTGGANALGTYQFTITAEDSFSPPETATQSFTLTVQPPPLSVANTIPSRLIVNRPFSGRIIAIGGNPPYHFSALFSVSSAPGLSFDASTGTLSGTPTVVNSGFGGAVDVTDSSSPPQSARANVNIGVFDPLGRNDTPANATLITNGANYLASISPYIDPPNGAPNAGDHDFYKVISVGGAIVHVETFAKRSNPNNPLDSVIEIVDGNGIRLNACRQLGDTSTTLSGPCINDDISASPHVQDSAIDYLVPGANSTTSSFYIHVFDWRGDARPDMVYGLHVSGVIDPLIINPLPPATRGAAYSQILTAQRTSGGPVTWAIVDGNLPPGLALANGVISGTATTDGSYSFTLQASDAGFPAQVGTAVETIVVGGPIKITSSATFPPACLNQPYSFQLTASGGIAPVFWGFSSSNWVAINLDSSTGIFSGTAGVTGTFVGRLSVTDSVQSGDEQQVSLTVQPCP
jgi:hypothetical protein